MKATIENMKETIKRHDLVIIKADKGRALVISGGDMYDHKIFEMIEEDGDKMNDETFIFSSLVMEVRWLINKSAHAIHNPSIKRAVLI